MYTSLLRHDPRPPAIAARHRPPPVGGATPHTAQMAPDTVLYRKLSSAAHHVPEEGFWITSQDREPAAPCKHSSSKELTAVLTTQYERWWNIDIDRFKSKWQFLRYAGRYIRRPPIAQHRFEEITDREVQFWRKDLKQKRRVLTRYSVEEFVATLAEHVPEHYRHAIRYFGLLAPRAKGQTSAALFGLLGQEKRPRPSRLSWRNSLRKYFGIDPLVDSGGRPMHWIGRREPVAA